MKDNAMLETNEYCKREICAIFGTPLDLVDSSNSNRATSLVALNNFKQNTVFPIANNICDQLTKGLLQPTYDNSFILQFDSTEALDNDPVEQSALFKTYIDAGIMTVEEVREKLGMI
jgi:phage portal protein BeeE